MKPRVTAVKFDPAGKKKSWKPIKTNDPHPATYDAGKGKDYVGKSKFIHKFAEPKQEGVKLKKETYTTMAAKQKMFVPGAGSYSPSISYCAIPYGKKRF